MSNIGRTIKPPTLQDIPPEVTGQMRDLLEGIINTIDLREGRVAPNTNTRFVTIQDLVTAGVVADGVIK